MKNLQQGHRIIWLVRTLTAVGLISGVITLAMTSWMLTKVRAHRAAAVIEQEELNRAADKLHWLETEAENETSLDESRARSSSPNAVPNLVEFVHLELQARHDSAVNASLVRLDSRMPALIDLAGRASTWRVRYAAISEDLREQRTIGQLRRLITQMRNAANGLEGRRRLEDAIRYRQWRTSSGDDADHRAQAILLEQGRRQTQDPTDFNNQLAELTRLAEVLGGEEQFDRLNDLKDNQLKPLLDRLTHSIATLNPDAQSADELKPERIEEIKIALFGAGNVSDDAHQDIQLGSGGLFPIRRDALILRRERESLKGELENSFGAVEAATLNFAQSTQVRTAALAQQTEQSLTIGWQRSLILGAACAALFLWLAWLISRGIQRQVVALETARAEAESAHQTTETLMIQQRESERRKAAIIESALDCIITINDKGQITEFNPSAEKTFGHARSEVMGKQLEEVIIPPSLRQQHVQGLARYLSTGESGVIGKRLEIAALRADGTEFPIELAICQIELQGGRSFTAFIRDITERKSAETKVENMHKELVAASREAGMAEVATGVLHNVGNVLNSVNVSSSLVIGRLRKSKMASLGKVVAMLREHEADLGTFMTADPRGKLLPGFVAQLADHLAGEQGATLKELELLQTNVDHIKEIVSTQQAYASSAGFIEPLDVRESIDAALQMNKASLHRHDIAVVREFADVGPVPADKHKVLQILVNLVKNARQAMAGAANRTLTVKVESLPDAVRICVRDSGCGIAPENLTRVFAHGFTTKKNGHGFGLHSSALAAKEMKGSLRVISDGPGQGASFILEMPSAVPAEISA